MRRVSRSIRRVAAAAVFLACLFLAGCDGRVEVSLSFPAGSEVDELLDAVVREDKPRIRSLLAPTVQFTYEPRSGWGFPRYYTRYFNRYEFADRLPHLFGRGDVVSASFHERSVWVVNKQMMVKGQLYWTVVRPWDYDSYTVTGILTVGLCRDGGEWLINELHFVQTGVHGRYGYYDDFFFDFDDFEIDLEFRFKTDRRHEDGIEYL